MPKRKGANSRRKRIQRKHKLAAFVKKSVPFLGLFLLAVSLIAGAIYGGVVSVDKLIETIDRSRLFTVSNIVVKGNNIIPADSVIKRCGISPEFKIYRIKTSSVSALLQTDPWIEKARCIARWWGTVAIEIKERTPIAMVNCGGIRLVDRYGVLMPLKPKALYDLPLITGLRTFIDSDGNIRPDTANLIRGLRFIERAVKVRGDFFGKVTQLDICDTNRILCIVRERPAMMEIKYDADEKQIRNLCYMIEALESGTSTATKIDLRFRNLAFVSFQKP